MKKISKEHKKLARLVEMEGLERVDAYREVFGQDAKESTCHVNTSKILAREDVQLYVSGLNERVELGAEHGAIMSKRERMIWLSSVVRTPINAVDGGSDLCQEHTETTGENCTTEKFKMPDKIRAISELNKMDGAYKPTETITTISFDDEAKEAIVGIKRKDEDFLPSDEMT